MFHIKYEACLFKISVFSVLFCFRFYDREGRNETKQQRADNPVFTEGQFPLLSVRLFARFRSRSQETACHDLHNL